ncbi:winged helix-turn-helix domain-containing protein [Streptacidiphilus jiangxiensis]|uniref:Transcriptional regulatory protein, C terminal n=1 Tax=Streptacidiphilus jiangxiensis TaxID=235985 RepID=A0A1H7TKI8_STRJI|nr:winged helix-turn-helix domain-containing protein [Streptacidiphilus jiangxiensis]SEL85321.1 Transcriptional regulatory protein, C terminal [Streptacidiphilus jiangxiensis]
MSVSTLSPVLPAAPRLRAVRPDESVTASAVAAQPGVYRLPPHLVGELPLGAADGTPLVGYLLLVPEGVAPALATIPAVPAPAAAPAPAATPAPVGVTTPGEGLSVDLDLRIAHLDGDQLELTYLEFELLAHLTAHPHRVHTRESLVEAVWGYGHIGDGRTVDVHVARLRRKLGEAYRARIVTVRRVGYKYVPTAAR